MVICPKYVLLCKKTKQIVGSGHEKWSFVLIEFSHFFLDIRPLYLDAQSTTPLDPRVLDAMLPYMTSFYGKFSLQLYSYVRTTPCLYDLEYKQDIYFLAIMYSDLRFLKFTLDLSPTFLLGRPRGC